MKLSRRKAVSMAMTFHHAPKKGYAGYAGDMLVSVLLFMGIGGSFYTMFSFTAFAPILAAAGILTAAVGHLTEKKPYARLVSVSILIVWAACLLALTWEKTIAGMNLTANQIADTLGIKNARLYEHYTVSAAGNEAGLCETFFLLLACVLLAALAVYMVQSGNLILSVILLAAFLILEIGMGFEAKSLWMIVWCLGEALFLSRLVSVGTVRLTGDGKARLGAAGFLAALFLIMTAVLILAVSPFGYTRLGAARKVEKETRRLMDSFRYQKESPSSMPEGDFSELGDLKLREIPAMEVVMSHPDSLYLRGYVGSTYNGNGWEEPDKEKLYENANLFFWLHQNQFFGQIQLARAALELDENISAEDLNTITVNNQNASSKYIYAPYELCNADASLLNGQMIGDLSPAADGFWGQRNYSYTALPNQVKRYTELVTDLYEQEEAPSQELEEYLISESHYNEFVYDTFTEIPENVEELLQLRLGEYDTEGQSHVSYQTAKQNILDYLMENIRYTETPKSDRSEDTDFLQYFLENTGEGYSVHYATAATLMFRYYGIPARYIEGYLITPEDVEGALDHSGIQVDGTRAHAWTEIYQDGIGWVPFEVTPPYLDIMEQADILQGYAPQGQPDNEDNRENKNEEMSGDNYEENKDEYEPDLAEKVGTAIGLILLALVIAVLVLFIINYAVRRKKLRDRKKSFCAQELSPAIRSLFAYTMDLLDSLNLKYDGNSLFDMVSDVEKRCGEKYGMDFREAAAIYEEARYSLHPLSEEQREKLAALNEGLLQQIKKLVSWPKRFMLRAIKGLY